MLAQLAQWILIATLSQSPQEAAWLKVIPADVDIAIRSRGIDATRTDLVAMLKAMSPGWGDMAENGLAGPLAHIQQMHGELALKTPLVTLLRLGDGGGEGGPPPFAVLVVSENYKGVLNGFSGGKDPELKHDEAGFDALEGPDNATWYATKGPGIVAFGSSKALITSIAKPSKTLDKVLNESTAKAFLSGDLGVYVNAAALATRFADQIDQGRNAFMGALDQAAQAQPGQEAVMGYVKDLYGGLFDSIKYADVLVLSLDVAEKGLHLTGVLNVKPDAPAAKSIAGVRTNPAATLGNLSPGAIAYAYVNFEAKTFERLQSMGLRMMNAGKPSPELEKALAEFHGLGRIESSGSVSFGNGMSLTNEIIVSDPKKYINASEVILKSMTGAEGQLGFFKDCKVEHNAQNYGGMTFSKTVVTLDLDKIAQLGGNNPALGGLGKSQGDMVKWMYGGDTLTYWYGTDGKRLFQVMAPTWDAVKAQIDGYVKGEAGIGATRSFKAVRSELPEQASLLVLLDIPSVAKMYAGLFATILKNPNLKVSDDLLKEPAFLGASLTPRPQVGYEFHIVIPSSVGTFIDKGVVPIIQNLQAGGANP